MSPVLVDTDILIEVFCQRDRVIQERWRELGLSGTVACYSPITAAELWRGMMPSEQTTVSELLETMMCLPITNEIGRKAGIYLRMYARTHGLQLVDGLIAATAEVHGCALWTRNRKHYPMLDIELY